MYELYNQCRGLLSSVRYSKGCISAEKHSFQANLIHLCENSETCSLTFSTVLTSKDSRLIAASHDCGGHQRKGHLSKKMWYILSGLYCRCFFFHSLELFFFSFCNETLSWSPPPGCVPSACIKYHSYSLGIWPSLRKHSQIMHSVMKPPSFHAHTLRSVWPLCISNLQRWQSREKHICELSSLKVANIIDCCLLPHINISSFFFSYTCNCSFVLIVPPLLEEKTTVPESELISFKQWKTHRLTMPTEHY